MPEKAKFKLFSFHDNRTIIMPNGGIMAHKSVSGMPRGVARRIMSRAKKGGPLVLTISRTGKPSRVYRYDEYQKMKQLPLEVKPWEHRKVKAKGPDPLGGVEGTVRESLSRDEIYKE
jgi:hypothetical protein